MANKDQKNQYWKSLAEKEGDPSFLEAAREEFPERQASRRDFLKIMGFSLSAASLAACSRGSVYKAITYVNKPEEVTPGVSNWYATTCAGCSAGCGLLVKVRDGRPIKIEGNPESALNSGRTCAVGQATVLSLYDEGRLKSPSWEGHLLEWNAFDEKMRVALSAVQKSGRRVVVLSNTLVSPSTRELIGEFVGNFSGGEHIQYDPVSSSAILEANQANFGINRLPHYRFDRAAMIVGINADFLGAWLSPVEFTRQYAKRRGPDDKSGMMRHVQFESLMSLTGSNADLRVPIQPEHEGLVLAALLADLSRKAGTALATVSLPKSIDPKLVQQTANELWAHRGESLLISGSNDVSVQILVNAINDLLGNIGRTVDFDNPSFQKQGDDKAFRRLIADMKRGSVGALIVYGANPLYDHPDATEFRQALTQVPLTISLAAYPDETAKELQGIAPDHHFLESWNDAQPIQSVYHLTQPTIAPLYDTRSAQESLLRWMGREESYYDYLRAMWKRHVFRRQWRFSKFDPFWDQAVHDGGINLPESWSRKRRFGGNVVQAIKDAQKRAKSSAGPYSLYLYEGIAIRDGRHANNPWLQELPDPITKATWENYASLAPQEARRLGLKEGDVVRIEGSGGHLKLPVLLQPGQPTKTIAVALGYGRSAAGKVGNDVGVNAYPFVQNSDGVSLYSNDKVVLSKLGESVPLALTQTHHFLEGRPIIKETILPAYKENPHAGNEEHVQLISLWPEKKYRGSLWGMAIDMNACTGCSSCVIACQAENNIAVVGKEEVHRRREMHWIRIDRYYTGSEELPDVVHQPMMCQHCGHAPCETVCPVLATLHSSDGLNQQVYNRCVGTRYCANNCPYKVRRFNWFDYVDNDKFDYHLNNPMGKMVLNPDIVVRSRGVMEKCSMCVQRIQEGKLEAKREGRKLKDGEIKMACEQTCPAGALVFGDLNDPESRVSKLIKNPRYYHVLEELNIRPTVGYLTKVRNRKA